MSPEKKKELKLRIFLDVEACFRKRGLIKIQNGYDLGTQMNPFGMIWRRFR